MTTQIFPTDLVFDNKLRITAMRSSEKEVVDFQKFDDDNDDGIVDAGEVKKFMVEPAKARGAVEVWLVELEESCDGPWWWATTSAHPSASPSPSDGVTCTGPGLGYVRVGIR